MKISGIASVLGMALVLCAPNIGCEDENNPPKRDAGGRTHGTPGPAMAPPARTARPTAVARTPAPIWRRTRLRATRPTPASSTPRSRRTVNSDRPADTAPTPDTAPMPDTAPPTPDTSPRTPHRPRRRPSLPSRTATTTSSVRHSSTSPDMCNGDNQMCTDNTTATDPNEVRAICFMNGVKKIATDTSPIGRGYPHQPRWSPSRGALPATTWR